MSDEEWFDDGQPDEPVYPYDAYDKREYQKVFSKPEEKIVYPDYGDSYFETSKLLIKGIAEGELQASLHGTAATYLFRHYLELCLKELILAGRYLKDADTN